MGALIDLNGLAHYKSKENAMTADVYSATKTYTVGDYAYYNGTLYRCTTAITAAEAWTAGHWTAAKLGDDVSDLKNALSDLDDRKADIDGYYEEMTVGDAEQIVSNQTVLEKVPYIFRKSGGDATIGKRMEDMLVGGTIVWNQLINNGRTQTLNRDSKRTTEVGTNSKKPIIGHKYCILTKITQATTAHGLNIQYGNSVQFTSGVGQKGTIVNAINSNIGYIYVYMGADEASGTEISFEDMCLFDLTQMFGATIADYILSLEAATAGAGVAFFKSLFPKSYYEYNAGELMSVQAASHDTVGFNLYDEEWEVGTFSNDGTPYASNTNFRSKNFTRVFGNFKIKADFGGVYFIYDIGQNYVDRAGFIANETKNVTLPANGAYVKFRSTDGITNYNDHQVCISYADGTYEPYEKHSYPLDSTLTLRGIPKLDSNNKLYYDGDTYASDGTVTRKYGVVDLGTLTWSLIPDLQNTFASEDSHRAASRAANFVCTKFTNSGVVSSGNMADKTIQLFASGNYFAWAKDTSYSDAATFKAAMSGVYLVYELATPTTETATPFQNPQVVDPNGTEEYVDAGDRDVAVPVGHETNYRTDLVAKIENLPSDFSTLIAVTEKTTTASRAYSVNQFLIMNNQLYKVTSAISSGGTITVGTNVTATTIGEVLTTLLNA